MAEEIVAGVEPLNAAFVPNVKAWRDKVRVVQCCGVDAERCGGIVFAEQKIGATVTTEFARCQC